MNFKANTKKEKTKLEALTKEKTLALKHLNDIKAQIKLLKHERDFLLDVLMKKAKADN